MDYEKLLRTYLRLIWREEMCVHTLLIMRLEELTHDERAELLRIADEVADEEE